MKHYKNLAELHRENGFSKPEHPLISIYHCKDKCSLGDREFTSDFYIIGFKKLKAGVVMYGRTKYDHEHGSMMFAKPRQVIEMKNLEFEEDGFLIFFHEDFINGKSLRNEISTYNYFDYETNEALHLSPQEEKIAWDIFHKIEIEYYNNQDEYSREIILSNISTLLKYAQRFYKRQFINRFEISGKTITKFNEILALYVNKGQLEKGLPSVNQLAEQLHLSPRYLSDLLKQETGKTALEHIHLFLISEAKNLLIINDRTVSEIAYSLGFDNISYFSRLFKKEVGLSPVQFKKINLN